MSEANEVRGRNVYQHILCGIEKVVDGFDRMEETIDDLNRICSFSRISMVNLFFEVC